MTNRNDGHHLPQERSHLLRPEQRRRVGSHRAGSHDEQVAVRGAVNRGRGPIHMTGQEEAQAPSFGTSNRVRKTGPPQVALHQQRPRTALGEGVAQLAHERGLALAGAAEVTIMIRGGRPDRDRRIDAHTLRTPSSPGDPVRWRNVGMRRSRAVAWVNAGPRPPLRSPCASSLAVERAVAGAPPAGQTAALRWPPDHPAQPDRDSRRGSRKAAPRARRSPDRAAACRERAVRELLDSSTVAMEVSQKSRANAMHMPSARPSTEASERFHNTLGLSISFDGRAGSTTLNPRNPSRRSRSSASGARGVLRTSSGSSPPRAG